jgi:chloride channel protein, CIC family
MEEQKRPFPISAHLRKYALLLRRDFAAAHSRDLHKWLYVAPIIGVLTGLTVTGIAVTILDVIWPPVLSYFVAHHWAIIPVLLAGFVLTGLIMQYFTPNPNEHSTEEIVISYHEHQGHIAMRPFLPKLLAAITTVGLGGSAALEGPGIYAGGAIGSWLWARLRWFGLEPSDRRIMLITGAAAGMAAVFRAPLTGLVFALEMPYMDDLAHEALVPSLIASVVAYATLISFMGSRPLFDFMEGSAFSPKDIFWAAVLGFLCGLITMVFDVTFRRVRTFAVRWAVPHWIKLAVGGALTGASFGAAFSQSVVHGASTDLFAAVGMAAFIAGGYKTPLAAVVFVAEATGGHAYIIPALVGAAVAYAVSGKASVSGDQGMHEGVRLDEAG